MASDRRMIYDSLIHSFKSDKNSPSCELATLPRSKPENMITNPIKILRELATLPRLGVRPTFICKSERKRFALGTGFWVLNMIPRTQH